MKNTLPLPIISCSSRYLVRQQTIESINSRISLIIDDDKWAKKWFTFRSIPFHGAEAFANTHHSIMRNAHPIKQMRFNEMETFCVRNIILAKLHTTPFITAYIEIGWLVDGFGSLWIEMLAAAFFLSLLVIAQITMYNMIYGNDECLVVCATYAIKWFAWIASTGNGLCIFCHASFQHVFGPLVKHHALKYVAQILRCFVANDEQPERLSTHTRSAKIDIKVQFFGITVFFMLTRLRHSFAHVDSTKRLDLVIELHDFSFTCTCEISSGIVSDIVHIKWAISF